MNEFSDRVDTSIWPVLYKEKRRIQVLVEDDRHIFSFEPFVSHTGRHVYILFSLVALIPQSGF